MDRRTPVDKQETSVDRGQNRQQLVEAYYESLDTHAYDRLETLLAPDFVHERPDMTLSGRAEFLSFMEHDRPNTDTSHPVDELYFGRDGSEIAARGRLLSADDTLLVEFVDVFAFEEERISRIRTFTQ